MSVSLRGGCVPSSAMSQRSFARRTITEGGLCGSGTRDATGVTVTVPAVVGRGDGLELTATGRSALTVADAVADGAVELEGARASQAASDSTSKLSMMTRERFTSRIIRGSRYTAYVQLGRGCPRIIDDCYCPSTSC